MKYLLDSDICIFFLQGKYKAERNVLNSIIILISLFLLSSCEEKPLWLNENFDMSSIITESIDINKMKINNLPLIGSKKELINNRGNPQTILRDCSNYINIHYDCWIYEKEFKAVFYEKDEITYLNFVDFNFCNCTIKSNQIELSNKTLLKEIKQKFPVAYSIRNLGVDQNYSDYVRIYITDGLNNGINDSIFDIFGTIVLRFKNNKLANYEYFPPIFKKDIKEDLSLKDENLFNSEPNFKIDTIKKGQIL